MAVYLGNWRRRRVRVSAQRPTLLVVALLIALAGGPQAGCGGGGDGGDADDEGGVELDVGFDQVAGSTVVDTSGNNHDGELKGGASIVEDGQVGKAVTLAGSQAAVDFGQVLDLTGALTVEAWVQPTGRLESWETIVGNWSGSGYWLGSSVSPGGVEWWVDGYHADSPTGLSLDNWQHVAGTFDPESNQLLLYLNGTRVAEASHQGERSPSHTPLSVGVGGTQFTPWHGLIDELRIWSSVRTAEEVCTDAGGQPGEAGACALEPAAPSA